MASSLSLFSPCGNAASIGLHSSAHDALSSYPYLVSTTGLRRRQLPQILSSTLAHGRHWKALAGDTRVHAEGTDIERGQEKNVRSLLPLYTTVVRLRAQSQVASLNATILHWKQQTSYHVVDGALVDFMWQILWQPLGQTPAHAGRSGWVCGSQANELLSILGIVLCVRHFAFYISLSTWSPHTCSLKPLQASGLVKLSTVNSTNLRIKVPKR